MPEYMEDLNRLKDPANIREAEASSSPYVLRKALATDPVIRRLAQEGTKIVPAIEEIISREGKKLPEISLAAFTYLLEQVDKAAAIRVMKSLYQDQLAHPGPFFVHIAAHAFRESLGMPVRPLQVIYSNLELADTLTRLK